MNADSVFAMLNEANPVPDPARYQQMTIDGHTFLAATKERTLRMETITPTPETQEPPTPSRGLAIAAAVFVIVIVGVALFLRPGPAAVAPAPTPTTAATIPQPPTTVDAGGTIPAPPFSTTAEAAAAYLTVKFKDNYEQLAPLMGVDGKNTSYMFTTPGDPERMAMRFEWEQATFGPYRDLACTELTSDMATCTFTTELLDMTRQGSDGTIMYTQSFTLDPDGFLLLVGLEVPAFTEQHRAAARAFNTWLVERHPDLIVENDALFGTDPVTRNFEEMRSEWDAAIDEYVAEHPPFGTPAEAAAAYLTVRWTGDYEQLEALMNPEGGDGSLLTNQRDAEMAKWVFIWDQAFRGPASDVECAEVTSVIAECSYTIEWLDLTRLMGDGTNTQTQRFTLDTEGRLLDVSEIFGADFTPEWRAAVMPFAQWLNERHPDLVAEDEAISAATPNYVPRPVEDYIADMNAAIDEYLAENG